MGLLELNTGTAVVTGGGSGIGEGFVRQLAERGMHVVVADIAGDRAQAVADEVGAAGGSASAVQVDVTDFDSVQRLADTVYADRGSVELLINNAGIESGSRTWRTSPEHWRKVMAVNLDGVFHGVRAFVPKMLEQGSPSIVANVSSVGAVTTPQYQSAYVTTKHAVLALTETLYLELAAENADIQVSILMPNWVRTRIFTDAQRDPRQHDDPAAQEFLERMRRANVEKGLEPVEAARLMIEGVERGDFWVFTEDRCFDLVRARGRHLLDMTPPIGN